MVARFLIPFGLMCLAATRALAFGDCTDAAYLGNFNVTTRATSCEVRSLNPLRFNAHSRDVRIFRINDTLHGDDDRWLGDINAALDQISFALEALGPRLNSNNISILLADHIADGADRGAHAVTTLGAGMAGECPVVVYKTRRGVTNADFAQLLAHEIFHCVQEVSWPGKSLLESGIWWVEGSAEYFAQLVVPDNASARGFIAQFGAASPETSLYDAPMDYENVVFFDWLHGNGGGDAVTRFLDAIPATDDALGFLQSYVPADDWVDFIERYATGQLTEPGGRRITHDGAASYAVVEGDTDDMTLNTDAYRTLLVELRFPEQGRYEISVEAPDGLRARMRRGGDWQDLPQEISACTDQGPALLYAVTTTGPAEVTLRYRRTGPCSACETARQTDRCLVGVWELTGGGPVEWLRANGMGDRARIDVSQMSMRLTADGRYTTAPIAILLEAQQDDMVVTGTGIGAAANGTWSAGDGVLNICPQTGGVTSTVTTGAQSTTMMFGPGEEMVLGYSCSGNTYTTTLDLGHGLPPMETTFTRAAP